MFKNLDSTDRRIIVAGLWTTCILTATVLVNIGAIDSYMLGLNSPATIDSEIELESEATLDTSDVVSTQTSMASVSITDNTDGTADIYINLDEPSQLTGAELYFHVDGEVLGATIDCSDTFDCVGNEITDDSLSLYAFRLPDSVETELSGKVKVATVSYEPQSLATLTANDTRVSGLLITELGTSDNLADPTVISYIIGD